MTRRFLGAGDIGGTRLRAILTDLEGNELARRAAGVDQKCAEALIRIDEVDWRYDRVAQQLTELLDQALSEVGGSREEVAAVGIGAAGPFEGGGIIHSTNIKPPDVPAGHTVRIPLERPVAEAFGAPAKLLNDCAAGVLGEVVFGVGKDRGRDELNLVYVTLSTGFGGGVYSRGHLLTGKDGNAAEVGHFVVVEDGLLCGCGNRGCAEAYASGTGVAKNARMQLINEDFASQMMPLARKAAEAAGARAEALEPFCLLRYVDASIVFEADAVGDPVARRVVEEALRHTGVACAHIANAYDPEVITVGGSLGLANAERLLPGVAEEMGRHLNVQAPRLVKTPLGQDVVLWGAVAAAMEEAQAAA